MSKCTVCEENGNKLSCILLLLTQYRIDLTRSKLRVVWMTPSLPRHVGRLLGLYVGATTLHHEKQDIYGRTHLCREQVGPVQ